MNSLDSEKQGLKLNSLYDASEFVTVQELYGRIYYGQEQCEPLRSVPSVILNFDTAGGHT